MRKTRKEYYETIKADPVKYAYTRQLENENKLIKYATDPIFRSKEIERAKLRYNNKKLNKENNNEHV